MEEKHCSNVENSDDSAHIMKIEKSERDSQRIFSLQECLKGIPPPPCITNPKVNVDEALVQLKKHSEWESSNLPALSTNGTQVSELTWPIAAESLFYDIYYNHSSMCETLDSLYERLRQRCVSHETSSFVGTPPPLLLPPESPLPCDFADLMPRSLSSPASPAPDSLSMELLAQRRRGRLSLAPPRQRQEARRQSPRKPRIPIKNPNLCLTGMLAEREFPAATSHKTLTTAQTIQMTKLDRRFITVAKKKTPVQSSSRVTEPPVMQREIKPEELSMTHRKKLLWATTQAFKSSYPALSSDSSSLKRHVAALFRLCQTQWLVQRRDAPADEPRPIKGTSERMLELATQLAPQVMGTLNL